MAKRKGQVTAEDTQEMFGDITDRISGTVDSSSEPVPASPKQQEPKQSKSETVKVSLYLTPEEITALDYEIIKRREKTGKSPRRSHLIQEAVQIWLKAQKKEL